MTGTAPDVSPAPGRTSGASAFLVGAGILFSRLAGLVRQRVFSHYLGISDAADAYTVAFRIPNFLQNLFGEGALSASFIPVYAGLLARGQKDEARRVAGAVAGLLGLVVGVLVLGGILATPLLIDLIAPGFSGAKRELSITLVRIFFPGAGLLVLSAWCLGVLNSHRSFLLPYTAPVLWNAAIIVALAWQGNRLGQDALAVAAAWGAVVGSGLQFIIQLPAIWRLAGRPRPTLATDLPGVRTVIANFLPAFVGRGVVQISAYVDSIIATLLPSGAAAALGSAQMLYTLPVSLFGMSVTAAELPAMSGAVGSGPEVAAQLRQRLDEGLRRIAFFIVPSAAAFAALGGVIASALFQTGKFTEADSEYVWGILAGSAVGLLAGTLGRLYTSACYALRDTRTPLRFALVRVALTILLGLVFALWVPPLLGLEPRWGAAGLTASAGMAGWVEFWLLRRSMNARIGSTGIAGIHLVRLWGASILAAGAGWGTLHEVGGWAPVPRACLVLGAYAAVYLAVSSALGVQEVGEVMGRLRRALRR